MQVSHTRSALSASFDEPNLIGSAGLVPMMELAAEAGLHQLAKGRLTVPTDKGANAGAKIAALVNRPGSDGGSFYWILTKVWSVRFVA